MHRTSWVVFKVLIISVGLMIIMDLSLMVIDYVTVSVRIGAIGEDMRNELSKNNCIPDDVADMYDTLLHDVALRSNLVPDDADSIIWNHTDTINYDGTSFEPINEENAGDYGSGLSLAIVVTYQPHSLMFSNKDNDPSLLTKKEGTAFQFDQLSQFNTVALRYLK